MAVVAEYLRDGGGVSLGLGGKIGGFHRSKLDRNFLGPAKMTPNEQQANKHCPTTR